MFLLFAGQAHQHDQQVSYEQVEQVSYEQLNRLVMLSTLPTKFILKSIGHIPSTHSEWLILLLALWRVPDFPMRESKCCKQQKLYGDLGTRLPCEGQMYSHKQFLLITHSHMQPPCQLLARLTQRSSAVQGNTHFVTANIILLVSDSGHILYLPCRPEADSVTLPPQQKWVGKSGLDSPVRRHPTPECGKTNIFCLFQPHPSSVSQTRTPSGMHSPSPSPSPQTTPNSHIPGQRVSTVTCTHRSCSQYLLASL